MDTFFYILVSITFVLAILHFTFVVLWAIGVQKRLNAEAQLADKEPQSEKETPESNDEAHVPTPINSALQRLTKEEVKNVLETLLAGNTNGNSSTVLQSEHAVSTARELLEELKRD